MHYSLIHFLGILMFSIIYAALNKIRISLLRMLMGKNAYQLHEKMNKNGQWYYLHKYAPESKYPELLADWYYENTGKTLNLDAPRLYNEKVQWLKLYDTTALKTKLSDKYLVRQWIAEQIGERYLIPLLGVWNNFEEINFDLMPNRFVLKANHGCNWLIIVKDKAHFNKEAAKEKFKQWLNTNFAYCAGLELQYRDIPPKIIAEEYLEDESGALADYKVYCFEGKPYCIEYFIDRFKKTGYKAIMFDLEWQPTGWTVDAHHKPGTAIDKPLNLDEMLALASILCSGFHHVRVDFYIVNNKIYFGEMTFTSASGLEQFEPEEWNLKLGELIQLPINYEQ